VLAALEILKKEYLLRSQTQETAGGRLPRYDKAKARELYAKDSIEMPFHEM
jgi:hypothetical protein